jgi:ATP-binding cassette subfamily B protein
MALAAMMTTTAIPAVVKEAIDSALVSRAHPMWPYVVALVSLAIVRALLTQAYRFGLSSVAFRLESDLRVLIFDRASSMDWSYFDRTASGQLISRANSDIRSVQLFLSFAPIMAMTCVQFVIAVSYMLSVHVLLTVVSIAPLPLVYGLGVRLRNQVFPLSWIVQGRTAEVATVVDESIAGVRVVRAFAAEELQIRDLARAATRLRWAQVRQIDARARLSPMVENLPRLGMAAVMAYGGWLAVDGRVSEGALFAFTAYVTQLQVPFRTLGLFLMLGQRARASATRIYEVLDERPAVAERLGAVDLVEPRGDLRFEHLTFGYPAADGTPGPTILNGFSLHVAAGETVALVGATGSGKSTVTRLLGRFYDPQAGRITIDGHDIADLTLGSLRHHVGYCFDEPFLFTDTIAANIAFARPDAPRNQIEAAARDAQADEFIRDLELGYDTVVGERGYTLSGGQRQRVALARALLANQPILVLDDATSAIDAEVEARIHDALRRRLEGRTTLIVAHRLSTIALADRVVVIHDGVVIASGTHTELLASEPRYSAILAVGGDGEDR